MNSPAVETLSMPPGRIAGWYGLIASLWFLLSDRGLVALGLSAKQLTDMQLVKGVLFVMVTGTLLYLTLKKPITRLNDHTDQLRESEARYRFLVEAAPDWLWEVDERGRYTYASPYCRELLGLEPKEIIGKTLFDLMPENEAQRFGQAFQELVSGKQNFSGLLNRNLHKLGHEAILETSGAPILDSTGKLIGFRGIDRDVIFEIQEGMAIFADLRLVQALMVNLLENSWKYSAKVENAIIRIYAIDTMGTTRVCVEDNGAGFDMAFNNKLFEPFQRLHRQDEFPGLGIGLATVQRIVSRHGGTIEGTGHPGKGATFCFTLSPKHHDE